MRVSIHHTPHATNTDKDDDMRFTHATDCATPNAPLDQLGEGRSKCPACKYISTTPVTVLTRTVCSGHTEQAVTPSGKGCPICAKARRDRDAKRAGKRIERRRKTADRARVGS
jgi:hypothetical protein